MDRSTGVRIAGKVLPALFILAIPLLLVTNSVTWAVNDLRLYRHGFDTYDVPRVTGIDREGLVAAARQIRGYFNSTEEPLAIRATIFGEERDLFNQQEVLHMRDVKRLIRGVYGIDVAAAVYIFGFIGVGFFLRRRLFAPALSKYLLMGSGLTLALVVLVGVISLLGFDSLFQFFHEVSFSNDLWLLDPRTDYLIMMFPRNFWFDATLFVAFASTGQAIALGIVAGGCLALQRRHVRLRREPLLQRPSEAAEL